MKTRALVSILILVLAVSIVTSGCATGKKMVKDSDKLYGTWVNKDYNNYTGMVWHFAKEIYNPDGTYAWYLNEFDTKPLVIGKYIITDSWTDSEGNIWFKGEYYYEPLYEGKKVSYYRIIKINKSGTMKEFWGGHSDYPDKLDYAREHYR